MTRPVPSTWYQTQERGTPKPRTPHHLPRRKCHGHWCHVWTRTIWQTEGRTNGHQSMLLLFQNRISSQRLSQETSGPRQEQRKSHWQSDMCQCTRQIHPRYDPIWHCPILEGQCKHHRQWDKTVYHREDLANGFSDRSKLATIVRTLCLNSVYFSLKNYIQINFTLSHYRG